MQCKNIWARERLVAEGLRFTQARRAILSIFSRNSGHLSAEDIYLIIHRVNPSIGFATVYRTLDTLTRIGILQRLDFGDGRARYELVESREKKRQHHHLICLRCGKIIDHQNFTDEEIELIKKTEETLAKRYNFEIKSHIMHFYGLCEECRKEIEK